MAPPVPDADPRPDPAPGYERDATANAAQSYLGALLLQTTVESLSHRTWLAKSFLRASLQDRSGMEITQWVSVAREQAVSNLTTKLSARNISVVVSDGEALHIDQINATEVSDLAGAAAKTYLDWYMLTQVRCGTGFRAGTGSRSTFGRCLQRPSMPERLVSTPHSACAEAAWRLELAPLSNTCLRLLGSGRQTRATARSSAVACDVRSAAACRLRRWFSAAAASP